jgi:hypothetical protein
MFYRLNILDLKGWIQSKIDPDPVKNRPGTGLRNGSGTGQRKKWIRIRSKKEMDPDPAKKLCGLCVLYLWLRECWSRPYWSPGVVRYSQKWIRIRSKKKWIRIRSKMDPDPAKTDADCVCCTYGGKHAEAGPTGLLVWLDTGQKWIRIRSKMDPDPAKNYADCVCCTYGCENAEAGPTGLLVWRRAVQQNRTCKEKKNEKVNSIAEPDG